jgi:hypothetical protein
VKRLAVLVLVACRSPAPSGPSVQISVDGKPFRTVPIANVTPLATLVPPKPEAWFDVTARSGDGRFVEIAHPATSYPGAEIRLYTARGKPAIGVFRPVPTGVPPDVERIAREPAVSLDGVITIDVLTHAPAEPTTSGLVIEAPGRPTQTLDADDLDDLKEGTGPTAHAHGWALADVLARAGVAGAAHVRVVGDREEAIDLTAHTVLIKQNHRGQYVVQVWDTGHAEATAEVRGVSKIVVE